MPRRLKVFIANIDGRHWIIMACASKRAFVKATGAALSYIDECCEDAAISIAMARPGVKFRQGIGARDEKWEEEPA